VGERSRTDPAPGPPADRPGVALRVLILGPLVVERDGREVDLGGPRQRSVLAALLLAHGRPVSLDRLIDVVYEGDPPPSAVGSMQAYISLLRRGLEPDRAPREPRGSW
jgi:DNA-binding SARP family transcriptional activator